MPSLLALAIRTTALFVAVLALGSRSRPAVLGLVVLAVVIWRLGRLPELAEWRRLWRNSGDPTYQGDGWRWTLSLLLPSIPLPVRLVGRDGRTPMGTVARIMRYHHGVGPPFDLDMVPLTEDQRLVCWAEWDGAQRDYERLGRPLERWETIERDFDLTNPDPPCFRAGCDGHPRSQHPGCCSCPRFTDFGDPEDRFHRPAEREEQP